MECVGGDTCTVPLHEDGLIELFPKLSLIGLFIFTVNNSRYLVVGFGHNGNNDIEKLMSAARMAGLVAAVSGAGALLWSRFYDHFESHKVGVMLVQGTAVAASCAAVMVSALKSFNHWIVSFLVFVCLFLSMGICPIRDAITSKQVLECERRGVPTPSFGNYRMFLAVGQACIAILSSSMMVFGDTGMIVVKASFMLIALVLYGRFPHATLKFLLAKSGSRPSERFASAQGRTEKTKISLLFFACLGMGMANCFFEMLFYPLLQIRGLHVSLLGLLHCVALTAECPLFYFESSWVPRIGSYTRSLTCGCIAMVVRLSIAAGLLVYEVEVSLSMVLIVFLCESLHGITIVPATLSAARLAAELAPSGQATTLNAVLSMAIGSVGHVAGLSSFLLMGGDVVSMLQLCIAAAVVAAALSLLFDVLHHPCDYMTLETVKESEGLVGAEVHAHDQDSVRVGLVHYSFLPVIGGVEKLMHDHALLLARKGIKVTVVAGRAESPDPRVRVVELPELLPGHPRVVEAQAEILQGGNWRAALALQQELETKLRVALRDCDVVFVHNMMTMHFNLAATVALADIARGLTQTRFVAWTHDLAFLNATYPVCERSSVWPFDILVKPQACFKYVVISAKVRGDMCKVMGIPADACTIIDNGVHAMEWLQVTAPVERVLEKVHFLGKEIVLFNPCRLVRRKNLEFCVRLTYELRCLGHNVLFLVTGACDPHNAADNAYRRELDALVQEYGVDDCFIFVVDDCKCSESDVRALYNAADAMCMTSTEEGFGLPVLEASLLRLPVFCPSASAMASIATHNVHTLDLSVGPATAATKVVQVLQASPAYRARREVITRYSWQHVFEKIVPFVGSDRCSWQEELERSEVMPQVRSNSAEDVK
eukprot:TRINITY_DN29444_c0_g1_i1.p1 TRINITY_DN29444_c0_g1~~TRINITY_DN29444_c0_g1_i1.p1  ORF type:complete len:882 (+),score=132.57 TRINITY_DN29444_c0_g1_i1:38-2683(+)